MEQLLTPYFVQYCFDFLSMLNGMTIILNYYLFKKDAIYFTCVLLFVAQTLGKTLQYLLN